MEELNVCLGFHHKVGFFLTALCQEGYVPIKHIHLIALFREYFGTVGYEHTTDHHIAHNRE